MHSSEDMGYKMITEDSIKIRDDDDDDDGDDDDDSNSEDDDDN